MHLKRKSSYFSYEIMTTLAGMVMWEGFEICLTLGIIDEADLTNRLSRGGSPDFNTSTSNPANCSQLVFSQPKVK